TFTAAAGTDISNGSVSVDSTWHENNGNPGTGSTSTAFAVDTVTPTAASSEERREGKDAANTAPLTYTLKEAPTDCTLAQTPAVGDTLGPGDGSADVSSSTPTFTAAAGTDISNGSVSVDSTWHENNGNPGTGSTSTAFAVDTVTPTAA